MILVYNLGFVLIGRVFTCEGVAHFLKFKMLVAFFSERKFSAPTPLIVAARLAVNLRALR